MLEFFRQHVGGGLLGLIIVGVLALAFVFSFGDQSKGWGKAQTEKMAAEVDGQEISEAVFSYAFNLAGGRNIDGDSGQAAKMRNSVIQGLIEREIALGLARQAGISASVEEAEERIIDSQVRLTRPLGDLTQYIESNFFLDPAMTAGILVSDGHRMQQSFVNADGKFDIDGYEKYVRYFLQTSEEFFVEQQRLEIIAERMRRLIAGSVRVSQAEVRAAYDAENNTAAVDYIRMIPSYFGDKFEPTAEEFDAWIIANAGAIKEDYEKNQFRYTNLEKMVRAKHILIKVDEEAADEERTKARDEITGLLARVKAGEDFAALAREFSQDEGSAVKGGDLGFSPRGRMVPEFDDAMFSAKPGDISDVVETKYGFHIIRVEQIREGNVPLEEATAEIGEKLFGEKKGKELAKAKSEEFLSRLKAGEMMTALIPDSENDAPEHLGLRVRTSQPFSSSDKNVSGIGELPELVSAAFAMSDGDSVFNKVFELNGDYFVAVLKERNVPNDEEFGQVKDELEQKLLSVKQGAWLHDRFADLKEKARADGLISVYSSQSGQPVVPASPSKETKLPIGGAKPEEKSSESKTEKEAKTVPVSAPTPTPVPAPAPAADDSKDGAE